ncbi:MAG: hypothetical protein WCA46_15320 [Actinocatenispora sp.]
MPDALTHGPRIGDAYGELVLATFRQLTAPAVTGGDAAAAQAGAARSGPPISTSGAAQAPDEIVERDDGVLFSTPACRYFEPPEQSPELAAVRRTAGHRRPVPGDDDALSAPLIP